MQPGTVVDRFVVESLLGAGGMASVFVVRHQELDTLHALKILHVTSSKIQQRMLQEGRIQARLRHPNIVRVSDVLWVQDAPALLLDLVEGPALDILLMHFRLNLGQADALARGLLTGVQAAHDLDLVHRDLKPANILLALEGEDVVPKIADFGLAKALAGELAGPQKTRSGATMGTPAFMAPEQVRDASKVDARADIFSLGAILYELVTGSAAFPYGDVVSVFEHSSIGDFVPVRQRLASVPRRMEMAIERALHADPDERWQSCTAMLECWCGDTQLEKAEVIWEDEHIERIRTLAPSLLPEPIAPDRPATESMGSAPVDTADVPPPAPAPALPPASASEAPAPSAPPQRSALWMWVTGILFLLGSVVSAAVISAVLVTMWSTGLPTRTAQNPVAPPIPALEDLDTAGVAADPISQTTGSPEVQSTSTPQGPVQPTSTPPEPVQRPTSDAPTESPHGRVQFHFRDGQPPGSRIYLQSADQRLFRPGEAVAPGTYDITYKENDDTDASVWGTLEIAGDTDLTLNCNADFRVCQ